MDISGLRQDSILVVDQTLVASVLVPSTTRRCGAGMGRRSRLGLNPFAQEWSSGPTPFFLSPFFIYLLFPYLMLTLESGSNKELAQGMGIQHESHMELKNRPYRGEP